MMAIRSKIGPGPILEAYRQLAEAGERPGCCSIGRLLGLNRQTVNYQLGKLRAAGLLSPSRLSPAKVESYRRHGLASSDAAAVAARVAAVRAAKSRLARDLMTSELETILP